MEDCGQTGEIPLARTVDGIVELDLDNRLFHKIELFFANFALSVRKWVDLENELPGVISLLSVAQIARWRAPRESSGR